MNSGNISILPEILERRSIFSFSDKQVEPEKLNLLFEAARWAPSSMNVQPWRFIYAMRDNSEYYNKIFNSLFDSNKVWAGSAPVLAISIAEVIMEYKDKPNRFAFHDLGMAIGTLLIQATSLGLYVHQMGGYDVEKVRKVLDIPERFEPGAILAIGYKGDVKKLPSELQKREMATRIRKEIREFVFEGVWGKPVTNHLNEY
jgi:nitroreductase